MKKFIYESVIDASPEELFGWHELPGAVEKLTPPWERVEMIERGSGLGIGTRVVFRVFAGPFPRIWIAEHIEYDPPRLFTDVQRKGPFASWTHRHRFEPAEGGQDGGERTKMIDEIEYELPFGPLGQLLGGGFTRAKLERMFAYRHEVVARQFNRKG